MIELSKAGRNDIDLIAKVLSDAFSSDPIMMWALGKPRTLERSLWRLLPDIYLPGGWISQINEVGAAVWLEPSERTHLTNTQTLRFGVSMLAELGWSGLRRAMKVDARIGRERPAIPHLYLFMVGVQPSSRGQGLGHHLIKEGLDKADKNGWPVYLETSQPDRVGYYEAKGFHVVSTIRPAPEAPMLWTMLRPA